MQALVVVDMQNDFISGTLGTAKARNIVFPVRQKIEAAIENGTDIFLTQDTHFADYLENTQEGRKLPIEHCIIDTWGNQLHSEVLAALDKCGRNAPTIIRKTTFGSFKLVNEMLLIAEATKKDYDTIEICGLCTDVCVIANAVLLKTAFPEARIVVDHTACAGAYEEKHKNALDVMESLQIEVI